jgi:hydrogenase maturation protease
MLMKKGILGIGNILFKDEGFGVHVAQHLQAQSILDQDTELLDGGTGGMSLSSFIMDVQRLLIIDVINYEKPPGTILQFNLKDFKKIKK